MKDIDLDEELKSINEQFMSVKLSDEFKENLCKKLEQSNNTNIKNIVFPKRLILVIACFVFVILGYGFASDFENLTLKKLSNIDDIAKKAVEEGRVKYLEQDFIEDNGISIKADYVFEEENNLYVVLEAKCDNDYKIYLYEYEIIDEKKSIVYSNINNTHLDSRINCSCHYSLEDNSIFYLKMINYNQDMTNNIVHVKKIYMENGKENMLLEGNWKIKLK